MDEGMNSFAGIGEAAVIDCETTGFDPGTDRIITVAVIRADFSRLDRGTRLTGDSLVVEVNPGVPIPEAATAVHGLRDADVAGWPPFADEAQELRDFIGDRVLVGHNAQFDKRFLGDVAAQGPLHDAAVPRGVGAGEGQRARGRSARHWPRRSVRASARRT